MWCAATACSLYFADNLTTGFGLATDRIAQIDAARARTTGLPVDEIERQTIARIPLGRYGDPAELGRLAAFLLSPAASYVTGAIVPIDGGMIRALP